MGIGLFLNQGQCCCASSRIYCHEKVLGYLEKGKKDGAKVLNGGNQIGDEGYYVESTIFGDVKDDMSIATDEILGPVMQILKFNDTENVVKRANDSPFGLAAGVF